MSSRRFLCSLFRFVAFRRFLERQLHHRLMGCCLQSWVSILLSLVGTPVVMFSSEFWGLCFFGCATPVLVAETFLCHFVVVSRLCGGCVVVSRLCRGCVAVVLWFVCFPAGFVGGDVVVPCPIRRDGVAV